METEVALAALNVVQTIALAYLSFRVRENGREANAALPRTAPERGSPEQLTPREGTPPPHG